MIQRLESRLAKIEKRLQTEADATTIRVVWDKNFYGNAHLLPPDPWGGEAPPAERDEGASSKPGGEDGCETG